MAVEGLIMQFGSNRCCGHSSKWRHFPRVFLGCLILSFVHRSSQVLEFLEEPSLYYYIRPSYSTIIPCQAADMDGTSSAPTYVTSIFFINGSSFSSQDMLPPYHKFWIRNRVVSGLLVINTRPEFTGWTYGCSAEYTGQTITSGNATLFLGDGRPLAPTEDPMYMTENGLSSLTIMWAFAPVPPDGPLQGYNINYTSLNDSTVKKSVETNDNNTMVRLELLRPGETYSVMVQGYNRFGEGEWSAPLIFTAMVGSVPPAPATVMAHSLDSSQSQFISFSVKWTAVEVEPAESTPVLGYSIYCSLASTNHLIKTVNSSQTSAIVELTNKVASSFQIGVAARNLAGYGDITYDPFFFTLKPVTPTTSTQVQTPLLVGAIVAAVVIFCILCLLVFIIILYLSRKTKSLTSKYSFSETDTESPGTSPEIFRKTFEQKDDDSKLEKNSTDCKSKLKKSESIELMDTGRGSKKGSSEVRVVCPKRDRIRSVDAVNPVGLSYDSKTL